MLPLDYYRNAIHYFVDLGYKNFLVFSDDIEWCKLTLNDYFYEGIRFEYSEGNNELQDLALMSSCEHNIVANSTFSYCASWFNQNNDKKIITPDFDNMFGGCHRDMIPPEYITINY